MIIEITLLKTKFYLNSKIYYLLITLFYNYFNISIFTKTDQFPGKTGVIKIWGSLLYIPYTVQELRKNFQESFPLS